MLMGSIWIDGTYDQSHNQEDTINNCSVVGTHINGSNINIEYKAYFPVIQQFSDHRNEIF